MEFNGVSIAALGVALSTAFNTGLNEVEPTWNMIAEEIPSSTSTQDYAWLGEWPDLRKWVGDRVIKELSGYDYRLVNEPFEATIGVKRADIEDDNVGIYAKRAQMQGRSAGRWPDTLVWPLLPRGFSEVCYDGQNFFDTDHPIIDPETGQETSVSNMQAGSSTPWYLLDTTQVMKPLIYQSRVKPQFASRDNPETSDHVFMKDQLLYGTRARGTSGYGLWQTAFGSKADLTEANLDAAYTAMMSLKNDEGSPLAIMPNLLVVPPALRTTAAELVKVKRKANGADNRNFELVEVHVSPRLA
jgi:phage major head subunit gpT-like protein